MNDLKNRRVDLLFERVSDRQIEVDIRKGEVRVSETTLEVEYVITVAVF